MKQSVKLSLHQALFFMLFLVVYLQRSVGLRIFPQIAISVPLFIFSLTKARLTISKTMFFYWIWRIGFLALAALSRIWAAHPLAVDEAFSNSLLATFAELAAAMYIYAERDTDTHMRTVIWFHGFLLIPLMVVFGSLNERMRFTLGANVNYFGIFLAQMMIYLLLDIKHRRKRNMCLFLLAVQILLIVLSGSRKAFLSVIIVLLAIVFFENYHRFERKSWMKLFAGVAFGALAFFLLLRIPSFYNAMGERLLDLFEAFLGTGGDDSTSARFVLMKLATEEFMAHPILGVGLNNFQFLNRYGYYAHTNYHELASCLGSAGLLLFYVPQLKFSLLAFRQWKQRTPRAIIPLTIMLLGLINDFGGVSYANNGFHLFWGIAIGMLLKNEAGQGKQIITKREAYWFYENEMMF